MWTREQLKTNAKISFRRNYWPCVGVAAIIGIAENIGGSGSAMNSGSNSMGTSGFPNQLNPFASMHATAFFTLVATVGLVAILLGIFIINVLRVGANKFFIQNRVEQPGIGIMFDAFRSGNYGNVVLTMFLKDLFMGLWSLLLVIPGIVKSYEYRMIPYILAENPGMDRKEAFAISKRMMDGEKWNAFVLDLSFLGWIILSVFTCGILTIFYVNPYIEATNAELYAYNKSKAFQEGYIQ